ncbi:hypothetical protein LTR62_005542 [Meristemomyces frigidus]|uniref:Uncharacterized protein n=1 Tax=Meristemomyces frigidus TaxID=1508187 RepID=A0AAN7TDQ1_9PEZI|nr:hypothetical protein LTR62_005542 [Meristemomyces frigidus]
MAEDNGSAQTAPSQRRSSFAGQTFAGLFGTGRARPSFDNGNNSPPQQQYAGPIAQAAAHAQNRRMSITTLGLSGSPTGTPYGPYRGRQGSISSSTNSTSIDESAIEDDNGMREPVTTPATPFARRMSFGAQALREVRSSSGSGGGGGTGQNGTSPTTAANSAPAKAQNGTISSRDSKGRGSADFWNENMRNRAQRTSMVGASPEVPQLAQQPLPSHTRTQSVAVMESPPREIPKMQQRPDHFQERILKGDFYMD